MRALVPILLLSYCCLGQDDVLKEWQKDPDLHGATISYFVSDAATGRPVAAFNEDLTIVPASTLKIFTTGAALGLLGKQFRFETAISYTGVLDDKQGIVNGDVLIIGSGDPSLQSEFFGQGNVCDTWAAQLFDKGIREIKGNIIGHGGGWERTIPDHWIWADIDNYFGAVPCGLNYRDNKYAVVFTSGRPGTRADLLSIAPKYQSRALQVTSSVSCMGNEDKASFYGDPFSFTHTIRGTIPVNRGKFSIEGALPDPPLLCAEEFLVALKKKGIRCTGKAISAYDVPGKNHKTLLTHQSPALEKIVRHTNMHSDNLYCESLLLRLGNGSREKGLAAVREFWAGKGLPGSSLFLADGSGLSRASTCTAKSLAAALAKLYNDTASSPAFISSLPKAGRDGSMANIGRGTEIENNLRAKTGYIQRVRAYAGFVKNREGKDLVFSLVFNHFNCSPSEARRKMEKFMVMLPNLGISR